MSPLANHADRADLGAPGRIAPSRFRARESHASRPLGSTSIASGLVASGLVASGLARLAVLSFGGLACFGGLLFFVGGRALADPAYNHGSLTFEDPDHDGLPSALEFILGSDPTLYDTDGDGFDDGLETAVGTDPLIPDESIPDQSDLRIEFFPIPDNRVGILFLCHGRHGMDVIHRFRVLAGRGTVYASHTNELARRGVRLPSANPKIASIAMTTRLDAIGERLNVIAEFVEDGRLVSVTRAIGVHAG